MHYIVFDLEWNQPYSLDISILRRTGFSFTGEIIQIGAVKLNESLEIEDTFEVFIKPKYLTTMHHTVEKLTNITIEKLEKDGVSFQEGCEAFINFIGDDGTLLSWGPDDIEVLMDNIVCHSMKVQKEIPWYDAQQIYVRTMHNSSQQYALHKAMEELEVQGSNLIAHNGLHDAICTALVCQKFPFADGLMMIQKEQKGKERHVYGLSKYERKIYEGIVLMPKIFRQSVRAKTKCPNCRQLLSLEPIVGTAKHRHMTIGHCETHGDYGVHWYIGKQEIKVGDRRYYISKVVTTAPKGLRQFYERKK